ncbi:MAG TPA: hypothetical protein VEW25_14495 [Allosphingosinicella sp.]|nr:hypothetical protein [Allosphingosinicella sp.]
MFVAWLGPSIGMILTGGNPLQAILLAVVMGPVFAMFSMSALWSLLPMLAPLAALVGGTIWKLGQTRPGLRRRRVWAAAGATVAAALYAAMRSGLVVDLVSMLDFIAPGHWPLAAMVLGGVAAALGFRASFRLLTEFIAPEELDGDDET